MLGMGMQRNDTAHSGGTGGTLDGESSCAASDADSDTGSSYGATNVSWEGTSVAARLFNDPKQSQDERLVKFLNGDDDDFSDDQDDVELQQGRVGCGGGQAGRRWEARDPEGTLNLERAPRGTSHPPGALPLVLIEQAPESSVVADQVASTDSSTRDGRNA